MDVTPLCYSRVYGSSQARFVRSDEFPDLEDSSGVR